MSKRRRGFPGRTHVKCGLRIVHGDKQLEEKSLDAMIPAHAAAACDSNDVASSRATFDWLNRDDYF
ncbi:MAG: hypothetical protein R3C05_20230 [Pirellulaceae bacterium]